MTEEQIDELLRRLEELEERMHRLVDQVGVSLTRVDILWREWKAKRPKGPQEGDRR